MSERAILCVDDELDILDTLCTQLLEEFSSQYEIEKAENAKDAFEAINDLVLDGMKIIIIISDWLMPGMRGDFFLIQVHKKYPDIVKIMLSGYADNEAIANTREHANLFAFIAKPWNKEELLDIIRKGLKNYEKTGNSLC